MNNSSDLEQNQHPGAEAATKDDNQHRDDEQMAAETAIKPDDTAPTAVETSEEEPQPAVDDEPNWTEIMLHDPARSEAPIFLAGRSRRDDANERFASGLDVLHDSVTQSMEGLVEVVNTLLEARAQKLYEFEMNLKNDYVYNDKARAERGSLRDCSRICS